MGHQLTSGPQVIGEDSGGKATLTHRSPTLRQEAPERASRLPVFNRDSLRLISKMLDKFELLVFFFQTDSHYVAQVDLELTILLPQSVEIWDYRCAPPSPETPISKLQCVNARHTA